MFTFLVFYQPFVLRLAPYYYLYCFLFLLLYMYWLCCHYYSLLIFQWGNIVFCHLWFNLLSSLFYFPYSFSLHWFLPHFLFCCEIQQQVIKWLLMCVISSFNILVPGVCFLSVTLVPPLCLSHAVLLWKSSPGTMNGLQQSRHQTDSFMKLKHDINLEYWKWEKDRPALINYSQLLFKVESIKAVGSLLQRNVLLSF